MRHYRTRLWNLFGLLLAVVLMALYLVVPGGSGLAAPVPPGGLDSPPSASPEEEIPPCDRWIVPEGVCSAIQVVVMIDQSYSMPRNDPQRLRFYGAENLADLLAHRYLGALTTEIPAPAIELAVLHFGSEAPAQYNSGWVTIAPDSEEAWASEFEELKAKISPETLKLRGLNATNFVHPFEAVSDLFAQAAPQDEAGCPQRLVLLLTDGAPAKANVLRGAELEAHMNEVAKIAQDGISGEGNFIYVTAFNVKGDEYWRDTQRYWQEITGDSESALPRRSRQENTPQDVASRMGEIIATHLGYQVYDVQVGPLDFPAFLQSMRVTYYAPKATASFKLVDPDGNTVVPDGEKVILTGKDTVIQALDIQYPQAGTYQVTTTAPGGSITLLPTFLPLTPQIEISPAGLQQLTSNEIALTLVDSAGSPLKRKADPRYELDVQVVVQQGEQSWPLTLVDEGNSWKASFLPVSGLPAQVKVTATSKGAQGKEVCSLFVEGSLDFPVAPVGIQVGEGSGQVCVPSEVPLTYPLRLVNAESGEPVVISVSLAWEVSAVSDSGGAVEAAIAESGAGQYELSLNPEQAGEVRTHLRASVEVDGESYALFEEDLLTSGLVEDQSLRFELGDVGRPADNLSLFFNKLFKPWIEEYDGQVVIGRRLFGWLGAGAVTFDGRFYNEQTGESEAGIERFSVQMAPAGGGPATEKVNGWSEGEGGMVRLSMPAPSLGAYEARVIDEGETLACTTLGDMPKSEVLLINDFWEYVFWIVVIVVIALLLIWLIRALLRRKAKRQGKPVLEAGMMALERLRDDPEAAIQRYDYMVDAQGFPLEATDNAHHEIGGRVRLIGTMENGVTRITQNPQGGVEAFYFPWVNRGVGEVKVPLGMPDGTLVVTGGMNGCAIEVRKQDDQLIFYHDGDNQSLGEGKVVQPIGVRLCRIEPDQYMSENNGEKEVRKDWERNIQGTSYLYQMLCVRHDKRWILVYSGIIVGPGISTPIIRSFNPGESKVLAKFDEQAGDVAA